MNMPRLSLLFGFVLVAMGICSFVATGSVHHTALIPAAFGGVLLLCGIIGATAPNLRMHVMHAAAFVGLLGSAGGLGMSLPKLSATLAGTAARPIAVWMQLAMGAVSLIFLALCVKSFIEARRAQKAVSS